MEMAERYERYHICHVFQIMKNITYQNAIILLCVTFIT